MAHVMATLPLERPPRRYDPAAADDNPFDLLYEISPLIRQGHERIDKFGKGVYSENPVMRRAELSESRDRKEAMKNESENVASIGKVNKSIRPALLCFHKSQSSEMSRGGSLDTMDSEASFEAAGGDDYFRMYGTAGSENNTASGSGNGNARGCGSRSSSNTRITSSISPKTRIPQPSPNDTAYFADQYQSLGIPPSEYLYSSPTYEARSSVISTQSDISTITAHSTNTVNAASVPMTSAGSSSSKSGCHSNLSRPSLNRPRPRAHPYEPNNGNRSREVSGGSARGISFNDEEDLKNQGRTMSEVMVAMAGLRCQKGRNARRGQ